MTVSTSTIADQLRAILALTNTEIQVAETRTLQARTDAVRRELTENAQNARVRAEAISVALRGVGAPPDVLRPLIGRLTALGKALAEQVAPLDEALLGDLALEHQLLDRSRYLIALATAADNAEVVELAQRLVIAHEATVEWLTTVLAEEGIGGPVALRRGPGQWGAGVALRVAAIPAGLAARGVDRAVDLVRSAPVALSTIRGRADDVAAELGDDLERVAETVSATADAGRATALRVAEKTARDHDADGLADAVHAARSAAGTVDADELPVAGYDELTVSGAVAALKELDDPAAIRQIVAFEEAHKNRRGVVSAAQTRLAAIAQDVIGLR